MQIFDYIRTYICSWHNDIYADVDKDEIARNVNPLKQLSLQIPQPLR